MGRDLSPAEARELLGAYALGALDDDEREAVEQLVLDDQDARAELHALQLGAAWLARSDLRPEPRVWEGIAAQMDDEPAPVSLDDRRRRRGRRLVALAVAAVVAIGVVVGITTLNDGSGGTSVAAAAHAALRDPDARQLDLRGADGHLRARLAVYPDGQGYITDAKLPTLDDRHAYQLWAITDRGPVSDAVLGASPQAAELRGEVGAPAAKYAITVERKGGSTKPTGTFVASTGAGVA